MVTKLVIDPPNIDIGFESCVVLDGDKTNMPVNVRFFVFESCVVLDGDKTSPAY